MDDTENPEGTQNQETTQENVQKEEVAEDLLDFGLVDEKILNEANSANSLAQGLEAVFDVPVQVSAVLGRASMPVHKLLKLGRGAVIELDRRIGESIDIYVNNLLVARGEIVVVDDRLGITMTEIIKTSTQL